jgi:7-cyano-7-deazaguanine synthase
MKSILILSGGLDSAVSAWMEHQETERRPVLALTFDYGQRASRKEQEAARKTAEHLKIAHRILSIPWLAELTTTSLVAHDTPLPHLQEKELDDLTKSKKSAAAVWVPNRNGIFLNIAAAYAEALGASTLITGFNAEEGVTFPDNSAPFVRAADEFFWYSTQNQVKVLSHTLKWNKADIARKAVELKIPLADLWFCYEGGDAPCGRCESCMRDFRAFREAGISNPWGK